MKKLNKLRIIWLIALIVFVAGIILSFQTLRQLRSADKKLKEKMGDISVMQEFTRDLSIYIAAKDAYQRLPGARPVQFESIFNLPGIIAQENIRSSEVALEDGWFLLRREVVVDNGELNDVMTHIKKAEAQRPPWKLSSCKIKSSSVTPGYGRVVLVFEALEQR